MARRKKKINGLSSGASSMPLNASVERRNAGFSAGISQDRGPAGFSAGMSQEAPMSRAGTPVSRSSASGLSSSMYGVGTDAAGSRTAQTATARPVLRTAGGPASTPTQTLNPEQRAGQMADEQGLTGQARQKFIEEQMGIFAKQPQQPTAQQETEQPAGQKKFRTLAEMRAERGIERPVLNGFGTQETGLQAPSAQEIRQQAIDEGQALIDATDALFQQNIARLSRQGEDLKAETASIYTSAGLAGTPFKTAAEASAAQIAQEPITAATAERTAQIATIAQNASDRAEQIYQNRLSEFQTERAFQLDERDRQRAEFEAQRVARKEAATESITAMAQGGYSIDEMPREQYLQLLNDSGMSDFEARARWAANSPQANANYSIQGGFIVGTYFDPITGKPVVTTESLPQELINAESADIQTIKDAQGNVYWYDANNPMNPDGTLRSYRIGTSVPVTYEPPELQERGGQVFQWNREVGAWEKWEPVPGMSQLGGQEIAKTDQGQKLAGIGKLNDAIQTYKSLIEESGVAGVLQREKRDLLNNAFQQITFALKDAEALGALQAPDIELIRGLIPDATLGLTGSALRTGTFGATGRAKVDRALKAIEQTEKQYSEYAKDYARQLQGLGANAQDPYMEEILTQAGLDPLDYGGGDDIDQLLQSFSGDLSTSVNGSKMVNTIVNTYREGDKGGQCGRFVNNLTGLGMGDSFESKMKKTDPTIKVPQPGDVFVMPYSWTGHTGFVVGVTPKGDGTFDLKVADSNYGLDERVRYHTINSSLMSGYARV